MTDTPARMRQIVGLTSDWAAHDLVLGNGEIALELQGAGLVKARIGDGSTPFSGCPYLGGALDLAAADARYVNEADTFTTGGGPAANKWPKLNAAGMLDPTLVNLPAALHYIGTADPTVAPPAAIAGDLYISSKAGTVDAAWGAPAAGNTAKAGDWLVKNNAGQWQLVPLATTGTVTEAPNDGTTYGRQNFTWTHDFTVATLWCNGSMNTASLGVTGNIVSASIYAKELLTGYGVPDGAGNGLELGIGRTGNGSAYIDFHGQASGDFDARIERTAGANGALNLSNLGTGNINLFTGAGSAIALQPGGNLQALFDAASQNTGIGGNFAIAPGNTRLQVGGDIGLWAGGAGLNFNMYWDGAFKRHDAGYAASIRFDVASGNLTVINGGNSDAAGSAVPYLEHARFTPLGRFGLGNANPTERMEINGNIAVNHSCTIFTPYNGAGAFVGGQQAGISFDGNQYLNFFTAGVLHAQINPTGWFQCLAPILAQASGAAGVMLNPGSPTSSGFLAFTNISGTRLAYIGNIAPLAGGPLEYNNESGNPHKFMQPIQITGGAAPQLQVAGGWQGNGIARFMAAGPGDSGIGVQAVNNQMNAVEFMVGNVQVGHIFCNASLTSYVTTSDQRLKENIADAADAGAILDAIRVRQFDWKATGDHVAFGMIAQELDELRAWFPGAVVAPPALVVQASDDPDHPPADPVWGVDYSKLVPLLVKELQGLRARVAQLEGQAQC